jgi:hypothetical protein
MGTKFVGLPLRASQCGHLVAGFDERSNRMPADGSGSPVRKMRMTPPNVYYRR